MLKLFSLIALVFSSIAVGNSYTICKDGKAYTDMSFAVEDTPNAWICLLQPDKENARCAHTQATHCKDGNDIGPKNVPGGGIYWYGAFGIDGIHYRCTCGCFMKGTEIASEFGVIKIEKLLENARSQNIRVLVRNNTSKDSLFRLSAEMRANNFTVGPEENPLYVIHADNNRSLFLTTNHPVVIIRNAQRLIVRASEVKMDDRLVDEEDQAIPILLIERLKLPANNKDVINFSPPENDLEAHIVVANSLQVGDNTYQQFLDIQRSREKNRLESETKYLEQIKEESI